MKKIDFTHTYYEDLLKTLQECGYSIVTVYEYLKLPQNDDNDDKIAILRHDIDRRLHKASVFASIEAKYGITSTYYFRYPALKNPEVIEFVSRKGHEIGYHYETMSRAEGDKDRACAIFKEDLGSFRSIAPVHTVCMHGAPLSQYNNLSFWNHFKLNDFNLIGEAFLSISKVEYFSDTGRTWSSKHKIRDFLQGGIMNIKNQNIIGTKDLIEYIVQEQPRKVNILTHPERWSGNFVEWMVLYGIDTIVNLGKDFIRYIRR